VPRFRLTGINNDLPDHDDEIDGLHDAFDEERIPRRRRPTTDSGPRVVAQGKSGRSVVAIDSPVDRADEFGGAALAAGTATEGVPYSSYDVATRGPDPVPDWLVTSLSALDTRLGTIKSGKEADVSLLDRSLPGGPGCLIAVKTFRSAEHRMFHRDAGYLEGRRVRRSRETRAMAARTGFGRELLAGQWAASEFAALSSIWKAGARFPTRFS
jgi:RIO kinase 1